MKKATRNIIIILILMGILLYFFRGELGFSIVNQPVGSKPLGSVQDSSSTVVCDADFCIISGYVKFTKASSGVTPVCSLCKIDSSGWRNSLIIQYGLSKVFECTPSGSSVKYWKGCTGQTPMYGGSLKYCINGQSGIYCDGSSSVTPLTNSQSEYWFATDEFSLNKNDYVNFNPINLDGSAVTTKYVTVKKFDTSCTKLITLSPDLACDSTSSKVLCSPQSTCQSGFTFQNSFYCGTYQQNLLNNICVPNSAISRGYLQNLEPRCVQPSLDNTYYKSCMGTQKTNTGADCGAWGNAVSDPYKRTCSNGQLSCSGSCKLKERRANNNPSWYDECKPNSISTDGCPSYDNGLNIPCPTIQGIQTVFNENTQRCVLPNSICKSDSDKFCNSVKQYTNCISINAKGIDGEAIIGFAVSPISGVCSGDQICNTNFNSGSSFNTICTCNGVNDLYDQDVKCINPTTFQTYAQSPTDLINSCLKYRDIIPNTITNTNLFKCNTQTNLIELKDTTFKASPTDKDKCFGNTVYKNGKYTENNKDYYAYTLKTDALNSNNGVCNSQYTCSEDSGQAQCTLGSNYVNVLVNDVYGVNIPINGIKIALSSKVPNYANTRIFAYLTQNGNTVASIPGTILTDSNGEATLNFDWSSSTPTKVTLDIYATDPNSIYHTSKDINISKKLVVLLNCPVSININRQVICTYRFADAQYPTTALQLLINSAIKVTDGTNSDITSTSTTNSITFTPITLGTATVSITGNYPGYISTTDAPQTITVNPISFTPNVFIDNEAFEKYASSGVTTGSHTLGLTVDESGIPADIYKVTAEFVSPTQQLNYGTVLTFTKDSSGLWSVSSVNFPTAGQTYTLHIKSIEFTDRTILPLLELSYKITTVGTNTQDNTQTNFLLYGIIAFGILAVIVVIVLIIINKRKQ